jgi:hypothetical protein
MKGLMRPLVIFAATDFGFSHALTSGLNYPKPTMCHVVNVICSNN